VQDAAQPDVAAQKADVIAVLNGMARDGMLDAEWPTRTVDVLNKADLLDGDMATGTRPGAVVVSALTGQGLDTLLTTIDTRLSEGTQIVGFDLPTSDGAELAWLYQHGEVIGREDHEDSIHVTVRLMPSDRARFDSLRSQARR
jgi:GTPase